MEKKQTKEVRLRRNEVQPIIDRLMKQAKPYTVESSIVMIE